MATEIEDMIFDYFGIIETQFEAATNHFKEEASFQADKLKIQQEIKQHMQDEYDVPIDDSENKKLKELTKEKAEEYIRRIRQYTQEVMRKLGTFDPSSGQIMVNPQDRRIEILLSQEKDKFYLETGLYPEQISRYVQQLQQANEPSPEERKAMLEKIRARFIQAQAESAAEVGKSAAKPEQQSAASGTTEPNATKEAKTVTLE